MHLKGTKSAFQVSYAVVTTHTAAHCAARLASTQQVEMSILADERRQSVTAYTLFNLTHTAAAASHLLDKCQQDSVLLQLCIRQHNTCR
jgi:hypothetical protein